MSEERRNVPESPLDAFWQTTNPVWGRSEVPEALRLHLSKTEKGTFRDSDGNEYAANTVGMWELLGFFTRDLRLGYLTKSETQESREWLEITSICASMNIPKSFYLSLSKVIALVEISQSRDGNLRRGMRTQTSEQRLSYDEPPKRFGKKIDR